MCQGGFVTTRIFVPGVIYMIDNNYLLGGGGGGGGGKRKTYISPRGSIPFHYMSGRGRGRNTLVCRGIIICLRGDGIHHLSRGMTVAENLPRQLLCPRGIWEVLPPQGCFFIYWNSPMSLGTRSCSVSRSQQIHHTF